MAEENTGTMNLDLNLGPVDNSSDDRDPMLGGSYRNVAVNWEDWLVDQSSHRVGEVVRNRHQRRRSLWRQLRIHPETRDFAQELIGGSAPQTGEGSVVASDVRPIDKICENGGGGYVEDEALCKKDGGGNGEEGSFFDCNICLDLAKDPVVTCCGHLFCWPCLYRWLNHHSDAKECPVCKGEVTVKNVTPIYGRGGGGGDNMREPEPDSSLKIPLRPQARRIESWRQTIQRTEFTIPIEEMIRRLGSTFDLSRELTQMQSPGTGGGGGGRRESPERSSTALLNRILTSRGLRGERTPMVPTEDVIDLTETDARDNNNNNNNNNSNSNSNHRRVPSLLLRRSNSHRAATLSNLTSVIAAERLVESYFHENPVEQNHQVMPPVVDDRDSLSSIAAVIHSESQTVDNAIEIDSTVSLSTSSSRRRNDGSRISDVDSGDSPAPRRRRLN